MRHFTIFLVVLNFSNSGFSLIFCLPFVLSGQKGGVFFIFGLEMFFQTSQVIFVLEWPKGDLLVFYTGNILVDKTP
jgi:hypothetical protein